MADAEHGLVAPTKVVWYRSTYYNALVLGFANFFAPGLWGAMNSLGAGGAQTPYLVNTGNALTFCLMVVTAFSASALVNVIGVRFTLALGTMGYAPYAAALYVNNRYGTDWFVLLGAALCGLAAGTFWATEAAVALTYPEPERQGKFLGFWLTFRVAGQIIGGAINLGINANNNKAGSVSYTVYLVFISLQCLGPVAAMLITPPEKLQRTDGVKVNLKSRYSTVHELRLVLKLLMQPKVLLIIPLIANYVYTESVMFTYLSLWFTVRARSLGSFISGIAAAICGNIFGRVLDNTRWSVQTRARIAFFVTMTFQGLLLAWNIGNSAVFRKQDPLPVFDWTSPGFGNAFAVHILQVAQFQLAYMSLYFFVGELASTKEEVVRIAGLLRAIESASQAVSYGLSSIYAFAHVYGAVVNLAMWGVAIVPGWIAIRDIGVKYGKHMREVEAEQVSNKDIDAKISIAGSVTPDDKSGVERS